MFNVRGGRGKRVEENIKTVCGMRISFGEVRRGNAVAKEASDEKERGKRERRGKATASRFKRAAVTSFSIFSSVIITFQII